MPMSEMDFIREGMKAVQSGPFTPQPLEDVQNDLKSTEKLNRFIGYIYQHHPALFTHAYKEASKNEYWDR